MWLCCSLCGHICGQRRWRQIKQRAHQVKESEVAVKLSSAKYSHPPNPYSITNLQCRVSENPASNWLCVSLVRGSTGVFGLGYDWHACQVFHRVICETSNKIHYLSMLSEKYGRILWTTLVKGIYWTPLIQSQRLWLMWWCCKIENQFYYSHMCWAKHCWQNEWHTAWACVRPQSISHYCWITASRPLVCVPHWS